MNLLSDLVARKFRLGASLALLPICLLLPSIMSRAGDDRPFIAIFHGFAEAPTDSGDPDFPTEVVVPLQGHGTHLGKFDELLVHHINFSTGAFKGHADWTAANGDTFTTDFQGQLFPTDDPNEVTFEVTHTIRPGTGTGRFEGATGCFVGINGLFNLVTGEDTGGYIGTISYSSHKKRH